MASQSPDTTKPAFFTLDPLCPKSLVAHISPEEQHRIITKEQQQVLTWRDESNQYLKLGQPSPTQQTDQLPVPPKQQTSTQPIQQPIEQTSQLPAQLLEIPHNRKRKFEGNKKEISKSRTRQQAQSLNQGSPTLPIQQPFIQPTSQPPAQETLSQQINLLKQTLALQRSAKQPRQTVQEQIASLEKEITVLESKILSQQYPIEHLLYLSNQQMPQQQATALLKELEQQLNLLKWRIGLHKIINTQFQQTIKLQQKVKEFQKNTTILHNHSNFFTSIASPTTEQTTASRPSLKLNEAAIRNRK